MVLDEVRTTAWRVLELRVPFLPTCVSHTITQTGQDSKRLNDFFVCWIPGCKEYKKREVRRFIAVLIFFSRLQSKPR